MLPLTPWLLVSNAITVTTFERGRKRKGVEEIRPAADAGRRAASLSFVNYLGFWSHFAPSSGCSSWPLPLSLAFDELSGFAKEKSALVKRPQPGDIYLLGSPDARSQVLAGIITVVEQVTTLLNDAPVFVCMTVEGELEAKKRKAAARQISARQVRRRLSPFYGDCFIRWCDLEEEMSPATIDLRVPEDIIRRRRDSDDAPEREAA